MTGHREIKCDMQYLLSSADEKANNTSVMYVANDIAVYETV